MVLNLKKTFYELRLMMTGAFILAVVFAFVMNYDGVTLGQYIDRSAGAAVYEFNARGYQNDEFVMNVTKFCAPFSNQTFVECVVMQVAPKYTFRNHTLPVVYSPTEFVTEGGVCRDIAVTYAAIFANAGWRTDFEFDIPQHVYNYMFKDGVSCRIDAFDYYCFGG